MTPSKKLFELIKSLSKGEKGYFKKHSRLHTIGKNNKYLLLFNAIEQQRQYDEAKLILKLKHTTLVKYLPAAKHYLYSSVLRSIRLFNSGKTIDAILMNMLMSVHLLYSKGLYTHCISLLTKAKALAYQYEKFALIIKILECERNIALINPTDIELQLRQINKEKLSVLHCLNTIEKYQTLKDLFTQYIYGRGFIRRTSDLKKMDKDASHPLLQNAPNSKLFSVLLGYYRTLASYHMLKRNLDTCLSLRKKIVGLYYSFPHMIEEDIENYINVNYGLLITASEVKDTEIIEKTILQLTAIAKQLKHSVPPIMEARIFHLQYFYMLRSLIQKHDFKKAAEMEQIVLEGIEHRKLSLTPHLQIYLLQELAGFLVFAEKLRNALRVLNIIMYDNASEKPHNIMVELRMLYLIIHFELGRKELLEYLSKSDKQFFIKHKMLYRFEKVMLSAFNNLSATEPAKQKNILSELKKQLLLLKNDRFEGTPFVDFDYLYWIERKIQGRSF